MRSKGRLILTFPHGALWVEFGYFNTPPPHHRPTVWPTPTPVPTPCSLRGSQKIIFIQLVYPLGILSLSFHPTNSSKKNRGKEKTLWIFFSLSKFSFWQLPEQQGRSLRAGFASLVLSTTPLHLVLYSLSDRSALSVHRQVRCN